MKSIWQDRPEFKKVCEWRQQSGTWCVRANRHRWRRKNGYRKPLFAGASRLHPALVTEMEPGFSPHTSSLTLDQSKSSRPENEGSRLFETSSSKGLPLRKWTPQALSTKQESDYQPALILDGYTMPHVHNFGFVSSVSGNPTAFLAARAGFVNILVTEKLL
jgi:hypothetical protein